MGFRVYALGVLACSAYQRERLQFRADGTAKVKGLAAASANSHVIFEDDDDDEDKNNCGDISDNDDGVEALKELRRAAETPEKVGIRSSSDKGLREAFLQHMRRRVEAVQQDDKAS